MSDHPRGVETRKVASGWTGVAHHGDGTCTKTWDVREWRARQKAGELLDDGGDAA